MARYSTKYGKRKYYYKRAKAKSVKAITTSRAFKASASNMTQNGKFSISAKFMIPIDVAQQQSSGVVDVDVPNQILISDMHKQLSNVFDQYRVEKCTLKFNLMANPSQAGETSVVHCAFFTAIDRTGFAPGVGVQQLRTYGSYKETTWSLNGDTNPPHFVSLGQADMVSRSTYYNTKHAAEFPKVKCGIDLTTQAAQNVQFKCTVEVDAQVRYRGVRLDTTGVLARINTL